MKRNLTLIFSLFLMASVMVGCAHKHDHHSHSRGENPTLYATLYQQQAAEYRALCYQAFNLASMYMAQEIKAGHEKPLAVVVDIDETVLDNSPYQAAAILGGFGYPVRWDEWMNEANAWAVPGSLEFLLEAEKAGVAVFYVTNRKEEYREATLRNLESMGFPYASNEYLLMRTAGNEKEERRNQIREKYHIALLAGDNLGDFDAAFETDDAGERMLQTDFYKKSFGTKYIVLPNAVYGHWVDVLPGHSRELKGTAFLDSLLKGLMPF
jgi:5'-nucleotidase (lipoprotein e(P4) family)